MNQTQVIAAFLAAAATMALVGVCYWYNTRVFSRAEVKVIRRRALLEQLGPLGSRIK